VTSDSKLDGVELPEIVALRRKWVEAATASDVAAAAALVTDDVVLVYTDGRCVSGKEEMKTTLAKYWATFDAEPKFTAEKTIVVDKWAVEVSRVDRTLTPLKTGREVHSQFRSLIVAARQPDGAWKISRILLLPG